jgi:hypothetical protein
MHLDNIKISFYQQMHLLLNIQNVKIYIKVSYIRYYMFRSTWTILRELTLSLALQCCGSMLPQHCKTYNNVLLLINSIKV